MGNPGRIHSLGGGKETSHIPLFDGCKNKYCLNE